MYCKCSRRFKRGMGILKYYKTHEQSANSNKHHCKSKVAYSELNNGAFSLTAGLEVALRFVL